MRSSLRIGRYVVDDRIAEGGFAEVLRGHDEILDVPVAIKVLHARFAADLEARERFVREARVMRRVASPHVLTAYDLGELDDGRPYYVAELATSGTLADLTHPVAAPLLSLLIEHLASGLDALHEVGVIHRDVKPANVLAFRADDGTGVERFVLGDLGFAFESDRGSGVTALGGTPRYRAPEQADVEGLLTPSTDLYAATATLWSVVVGEEPPQPHAVRPALYRSPAAWRPFFRRGLAEHPRDRFDAAGSWCAAALAALAENGGVQASSTWPADRSPFVGLDAFSGEHAAVFFGRDEVVRTLLRRLARPQLVVLGGASGVGKSSVVNAGLGPALSAGRLGGGPIDLVTLHAGHADLADQVAEVAARECVLVIDQFEQVLGGTQAPSLANKLQQLVDDGGRVVVVLRSDFYPQAAEEPSLRVALERHVLVAPLSPAEVREVIEGPASVAGLRVDEDLIERLQSDTARAPGGLPLLAHALEQAWRHRTDQTLSTAAYEAAGGLEGSVDAVGEALLASMSPDEVSLARSTLLRLVAPGDRSLPDTRRVAATDDWPEPERLMLARIVEARLARVDGTGRAELAHDSIIDSWRRLRGWVDEERALLRARLDIENDSMRWATRSEPDDLLLRGVALDAAHDVRRAGPTQLSSVASRFVEASTNAAQRRARRQSRLLAAVTLLALVAVAAAVAAAWSRARANEESDRAEVAADVNLATRLAQQAQSPELPLRVRASMALEAAARAPTEAVVRQALADTATRSGGDLRWSGDINSRGLFVAWVSGDRLVVVSEDGRLHLYDARDGRELATSDALPSATIAATASNRPTVVVAGAHSAAVVFDVNEDVPRELARLDVGSGQTVTAVGVSPDGDVIAVAASSGDVHIWAPLSAPEPMVVPTGGVVWDLAFSSDGAMVSWAGVSGAAALDVRDGTATTLVDDAGAWSVAVHPTEGSVAVGLDGGVSIADPSGDAAARWLGDTCSSCPIWDLSFSPTGSHLIVASEADHAIVWDLGSPGDSFVLSHGRAVADVSFSPDGRSVATAGKDDIAQIAVLDELGDTRHVVTHGDWVWASAFSPDSRWLATASSDETVRVWAADNLPRRGLNPTGPPFARDAAPGPDGTVVLVDSAGVATLWEVGDGRAVLRGPLASEVDLVETHPTTWRAVFVRSSQVEIATLGPDGSPSREVVVAGEGRVTDVGFDRAGEVVWLSSDLSTRVVSAEDGRVLAADLVAAAPSETGLVWLDRAGRLVELRGGRELDTGLRVDDPETVTGLLDFGDERVVIVRAVGIDLVTADGTERLAESDASTAVAVAVTVEGKRGIVAGFANGRVRAWLDHGGVPVWEAIHGDFVRQLAVFDDGVVGSMGPGPVALRYWDVGLGTLLSSHQEAQGGHQVGAVSRSTESVVLVDEHGAIGVWATPGRWLDGSCAVAGPGLTDAEWELLVGDANEVRSDCGPR